MARINALADINIIVATGIYTYGDVPFFFQYHGPGTLLGGREPMVDLFVQDLTEGIAGTRSKAALLKCAVEGDLTPGVERILRAVAEARKRTGAPITRPHQSGAADRSGGAAGPAWRRVDRGAVVMGQAAVSTSDLDHLRGAGRQRLPT